MKNRYIKFFEDGLKDVEKAVNEYVKKIQDFSDDYYKRELKSSWDIGLYNRYSATKGGRYYRISFTNTPDNSGGGSVFAFVDSTTGDIYKPAGWKSPAKGVRGNVFNDKVPLSGRDLYR